MNRRRQSFPSRVLQAMAALTWVLTSACAEPRPAASSATDHWAFQPLRRPAAPGGTHPVDAFVHAALRTNGLTPLPPAAPRELLRRVYFDLIGLPPTPAELATFERECAEDENLENRKAGKRVDTVASFGSGVPAFQVQPAGSAYTRVVDQLLASPHYGERWARHWLDVVRFTESQGFEYDRPRDHAWPYRDYVIRAFNADKPYDRFMREQVAGDVLEPVTADGIVAAGLLVCGPWDQAGNSQANATQRAITREEELEDLIGVVGQTFLGLTVNCARCHDHKFDPIPLTDYYRVKAVFDGVKHGDRSVEDAIDAKAREGRREAAKQRLATAQAEVARIEAEGAKTALAKRSENGAATEPGPIAFARWDFASPTAGPLPGEPKDGATLADGRLRLPKAGAYFQTVPLTRDVREKTLEAWVALSDLTQAGGAAISLEAASGAPFDAIVFAERQPKKWMAGSEGFARTRDLDAPDETAPPGTLIHLAAVYSADNRVALYRNGEPYGQPYAAGPLVTFKAGDARITLGRRHLGGGKPWLTGAIRQAALYDRALDAAEVTASFRAGGFVISTAEILTHLNPEQRTAREQSLAQMDQARKEIAAAEKTGPLAYAGKREQPAPTKALLRGDVKKPGDVVAPGALTQFAALPGDFALAPDAPEAERRRRFADWLADPRNPLPARVMVNRVLQFHFGQGLVTTPSDFGLSGARPSHPELLDWLASEFIASGWSVKALHRLILTSATYRQSSGRVISGSVVSNQSGRRDAGSSLNTDALNTDYFREASAKDADNTLLWRFTPRRLEAEAVRDAMLAVSGQLNPQFGGPSFRPFTTSEYGATFYHLFDKGEPEFNRRTIYRMNINSGKEPLLDAFDCPDPSVKTPRRGVTTTPLQALSVMNGSFVQRQAGELAKRALQSAGGDLPRAVNAAYELALSRPATAAEQSRAEAAARERGLASVCWALLNSTEFVYVR